jgi:hypothetical protein
MASSNTAKLATDKISSASFDYTPKFASIAAASSGTNELVAAVASKKIRVVSLFLIAAGTVNAYFEDDANTALAGDGTNKIALIASSGFSLNFNPVGWFETGSGQALEVNLSAATAVAGSVTYIEV